MLAYLFKHCGGKRGQNQSKPIYWSISVKGQVLSIHVAMLLLYLKYPFDNETKTISQTFCGGEGRIWKFSFHGREINVAICASYLNGLVLKSRLFSIYPYLTWFKKKVELLSFSSVQIEIKNRLFKNVLSRQLGPRLGRRRDHIFYK